MIRRSTPAPAKINLSLRVLRRRPDGFHDLASVVAFADAADELSLLPGDGLSLAVEGPMAAQAGPDESNLVLRAARALRERAPELRMGNFALTKNLPAGAGLGGGSSDAAAALRLLADANDFPRNDPRVMEAAAAIGSDVSVCLDTQARLLHGRGEIVSAPLDLPALPVALVFPGTGLPTAKVFGSLDLNSFSRREKPYQAKEIPRTFDTLINFLNSEPNDLETAARKLLPEIGKAIEAVRLTDAALARMSGSGSAVFGIYETRDKANNAARQLQLSNPNWWVTAATLT